MRQICTVMIMVVTVVVSSVILLGAQYLSHHGPEWIMAGSRHPVGTLGVGAGIAVFISVCCTWMAGMYAIIELNDNSTPGK